LHVFVIDINFVNIWYIRCKKAWQHWSHCMCVVICGLLVFFMLVCM